MNAILRSTVSTAKASRAKRASTKPAVAGSVKSGATLDRETSAAKLREAQLAAARRDALRRYALKLEGDSAGAQRLAYFVRHPDATYVSRNAVEAWIVRVCDAAGVACRYAQLEELIPA